MPEHVQTQVDSEPSGGQTAPATHLVTGMAVGRYLVGESLGEGGMGVVYLARDRLLDRKVALKVLKADDRARPDPAGQDRLFAEARKLAQLQDPHIVAVYDVGTFGDQVYFAMEYMPGSLRGLLAEGPPGPGAGARRLRLLLEAGQGLAAAHRAGIVHRDFKPDNVLLDAEGRARVSDFGLALPVGAGEVREGTPGYLPPGASPALASPASDQYAFCATAWEALTGALPGRGEGAGLAPYLRRVLQRGLAEAPQARYPSMEALLQALEADPARTRRHRLLAGGGVVAVLASLGVAGAALSRETPREAQVRRCKEQVKQAQVALWGAPRQAELVAAFAAQGPAGVATSERVRQELGGEVETWAQLATSACARPEESARRRLEACLSERQLVLGTLSQLFAQADADVVANAITTTSLAVVPVALCAPSDAGAGPVAPPEAGAALRPRLARAQVLFAAGRYGPAREAAEAVGDDAEREGAWHVVAEARLLEGRVGARLRTADADEALRQAITVADRAQADEQRASGWVALASWLAGRGRDVEARLALVSAEAVVERLGRPPLLEAEWLTAEGRLESERSGARLAVARRAFERALELRRRALSPTHPLVINALANWATVLPPEQRLPWQRQVLAQRVEAFGPRHLETAAAQANLGSTALELSRCAEARDLMARARASLEAGQGSDPLGLGRVHAVLAHLELRCGNAPATAWQEGQEALSLLHRGRASDLELRRQLRALLELRPLAGRPAAEAQGLQDELDSLDEEVTTRRPGAPPGP